MPKHENSLVENNWLTSLIEAAVKAKSDAAQRYAETMEEGNPTLSRSQIAERAIYEDSIWAGLVGIGSGAINALPGVGQAIALGSIAPEIAYLFYLQTTLVVYLCKIYDKNLTDEQIKIITLCSFGGAAGVEAIKEVMKGAAARTAKNFINAVLKGAVLRTMKDILKMVGIKFTKKGLLRKLPFISLVINPVMNYGDIKLVGMVTKDYLEEIYGKCKHCGHKMPETGRFCSVCGKPTETTTSEQEFD